MDRQRSLKSRLSKQAEFEEMDEEVTTVVENLEVESESTGAVTHENKRGREKSSSDLPIPKAASVDGSSLSGRHDLAGSLCLKDRSESASSLLRHRINYVVKENYFSHPKVKLLQRSHALCDDTSPPPEFDCNTLSVSSQNKMAISKHQRLGKQGSSGGSLDSNSSALSRDSSLEQYTDSTGVDLQQFIIDTLHKNQKDRIFLLKIEQELISLVKDSKRQHIKFPQMSAYQRMFVHRVAAFFGLDHNIDQNGTAVIVNKTKNTRIPDMKFRDQIRDELVPDEPKKSILKRDSSSFEDGKDMKSPERQLSSDSRRSKSFEEREEEYGKSSSSQEGVVDSPLRSHESTHNSSRRSSQEDLRWPSEPRPWSSTDSDCSNRANKLVITKTSASTESEPSSSDRLSATDSGSAASKLMSKSESAESGGSRDSLLPVLNRRSVVPKASSFGGISVLVRADSAASTKSASPRLTKAESLNSGGDCSVAFKDVRSDKDEERVRPSKLPVTSASVATSTTTVTVASSATSPISSGAPPTPQSSFPNCHVFPGANVVPQQGMPVVWAVSNVESVPPGSILINPQTGQPYLNTDGTVYRHNPTGSMPVQQPMLMTATGVLQQPSQPVLQQLHPAAMAVASPPVSVAAVNPAPPFVLCNPTVQLATHAPFDQRQFSMQEPNSITEMTSQLSGMAFSSLQPPPADVLTSGEAAFLQGLTGHPAGFGVNQGGSVSRLAGNVSQQHASQMASVYYIPSTQQQNVATVQPLRYVCQLPYASTVTQSATSGQNSGLQTPGAASAVLEGHAPLPNAHSSQTSQQQAFQLFQGGQCLQTYPVVGYAQHLPISDFAYGVSPYYPVASQQIPVSSTSFAYPAYAQVASSVMNPSVVAAGTQVNSGSMQTLNPSQTGYLPGAVPLCGLMSSSVMGTNGSSNGGCGTPTALPVPPFFPPNQSFRSQTPPAAQPQGNQGLTLASGCATPSQHPVQCQGRTYTLAAPGQLVTSGLTMYSTQLGGNCGPHVQQSSQQMCQPQQHVPLAASTSRTPPQFAPQFLASLPLFRPNMQMLVRPNTPPPVQASVLQAGAGQYAAAASASSVFPKTFGAPLVEQRFVKASDVYLLDASVAALGDNKGMSTIPSLAPLPNGNTAIIKPNMTPVYGRGLPLVQGDMRLIGTPLQQQMQTALRVPVMIPQQKPTTRSQYMHQQTLPAAVVCRPPKIKRQRSKVGSMVNSKPESLSSTTSQSFAETEHGGNRILEVQGLPEGIRKSEAERYLEDVTRHGAKLQFVRNNRSGGGNVTPDSATSQQSDFSVNGKTFVYAVFESETDAQSALLHIKTSKFQLRPPTSKHFLAAELLSAS